MKSNALRALLNEKQVLLADGATGTNYFEAGLGPGDPPELWNVEQPDKVENLHRAFVEAGADIILTNTFGCNRHRLKLHQLEGRVHELNKAAAEIARRVADAASRKVIVAGSVGPTGELFEPLGQLTHEAAVLSFREQMEGLKAGGADVAWIETMSSPEEIQTAIEAAKLAGIAFTYTASFDTAGRTMMGLEPGKLGEVQASVDGGAVAYGANCGVGASDLLVSVLSMTESDPEAIIIAKANCGVPQVRGGEVVYTGTPELMADYVALAIDSGVRIVGGCCGTTPVHLAAMRVALDAHRRGERPDRAAVESALGALVNPVSQGPAAVRDGARRGRRRRD